MSTRTVKEIRKELEQYPDENVKALVKELCNAFGGEFGRIKNKILEEMDTESEEIEGKDDRYISALTMESIIRTATDTY